MSRKNTHTELLQKEFQESLSQCAPPVGIAKDILASDQVKGALSSVPHLGSLAGTVSVSASRFDYVRLWVDVLAKIKHNYPGLGLNSSYNRSRRGGLTRLEILQLWVILANCGHLARTFSTERAVLYILSKSPEESSAFMRFLNALDGTTTATTEQCRAIVDKGNYLSFFYVLATWRLFAGDMTDLPSKKRVRAAWHLYFETSNDKKESSRMLQWLFRKSRQIVTAHIHSLMQIGPSTTARIEDLVREIFPGDSIAGYSSSLAETDVSRHLADLESLHLKVFFTSPNANLHALKDKRACKNWWEEHRFESVEERILSLFRGPSDWPQQGAAKFPHFCRLYLPAETPREMWRREVERWKELEWSSGEYVISPIVPSGLSCDIYMDESSLDLGALCRAASVMASKFYERNGYGKEARQKMEASIANLGVRLLSRVVSKRGLISVRPISSTGDGSCGLAALSPEISVLTVEVRLFASTATDPIRRRELEWFSQWGKSVSVSHGDNQKAKAALLFLGRMILMDRETEKEVTDMDLVLAEFFDDTIVWTFCQLKEGGQTGGNRQLEKTRDYLTSLGPVQQVADSGSDKCWIARIEQRCERLLT